MLMKCIFEYLQKKRKKVMEDDNNIEKVKKIVLENRRVGLF